jgi:hypothetical protein
LIGLSPLASFTLQTNRIAPRGLERADRKTKARQSRAFVFVPPLLAGFACL